MITEDRFQEILVNATHKRQTFWPTLSKDFETYFLKRTAHDALQPLLYYLIHQNDSWHQWPSNIQEVMAKAAKREAIIEEQNRAEVLRVLNHLAKNNISTLIFKG